MQHDMHKSFYPTININQWYLGEFRVSALVINKRYSMKNYLMCMNIKVCMRNKAEFFPWCMSFNCSTWINYCGKVAVEWNVPVSEHIISLLCRKRRVFTLNLVLFITLFILSFNSKNLWKYAYWDYRPFINYAANLRVEGPYKKYVW